MHTVRKIREEENTPNSNWNLPLTYETFTVASVTGTGSITFTGGNGGALGTDASYTPPTGQVPYSGGGTLGPAPSKPGNNNVTDVAWDGTYLSFSYGGYSYLSGQLQPSQPGTTIVRGTIQLPSGPAAIQKNWSATH